LGKGGRGYWFGELKLFWVWGWGPGFGPMIQIRLVFTGEIQLSLFFHSFRLPTNGNLAFKPV
jgi:hypothetical protein